MQKGMEAPKHVACLHQLTCLPAAAIFSSGGKLGTATTAESQGGMKGLTLRSHDAHGTQQSTCLWEVTPHARDYLQEKANCIAQRRRASNPIPHAKTPSKKGIWNTTRSRTLLLKR